MLAYWFYWDPDPVAFTIPWLGRPVAWYGILFVLGFLVGYQIVKKLLVRGMHETGAFTEHHVDDWPKLLANFKVALTEPSHPLHTTAQQLPREVRKAVESGKGVDRYTKEAIVRAIQLRGRTDLGEPQGVATAQTLAARMADRLTWFVVLGTLIGARLGHILFYDLAYYLQRPADIVKVWEGGLASHGGALGVILALYLSLSYMKRYYPSLTFLRLLDLCAYPTAFVACCIRLGNFMNQELVGIPTDLPWAVLFGHPADHGPLVPRHPVPLYDAFANLALFALLGLLWRAKGMALAEGTLLGLFLLFCFSARILIDFVKMPFEASVETGVLQMGQWLSLPFIMAGLWLLARGWARRSAARPSAAQKPFGRRAPGDAE